MGFTSSPLISGEVSTCAMKPIVGHAPRDGGCDGGKEVAVRVPLDVRQAELAQLVGEEVEQHELPGVLGTLVDASSARVSMVT